MVALSFMGYIQGEGPQQSSLFPPTLEELVPEDHLVRVIQDNAYAQLFVGAALGGDLPDDFTPCMFGTLLHPGVARIGTYHVLFAVQQLVDATLAAVPTTLCTQPDSASAPI